MKALMTVPSLLDKVDNYNDPSPASIQHHLAENNNVQLADTESQVVKLLTNTFKHSTCADFVKHIAYFKERKELQTTARQLVRSEPTYSFYFGIKQYLSFSAFQLGTIMEHHHKYNRVLTSTYDALPC